MTIESSWRRTTWRVGSALAAVAGSAAVAAVVARRRTAAAPRPGIPAAGPRPDRPLPKGAEPLPHPRAGELVVADGLTDAAPPPLPPAPPPPPLPPPRPAGDRNGQAPPASPRPPLTQRRPDPFPEPPGDVTDRPGVPTLSDVELAAAAGALRSQIDGTPPGGGNALLGVPKVDANGRVIDPARAANGTTGSPTTEGRGGNGRGRIDPMPGPGTGTGTSARDRLVLPVPPPDPQATDAAAAPPVAPGAPDVESRPAWDPEGEPAPHARPPAFLPPPQNPDDGSSWRRPVVGIVVALVVVIVAVAALVGWGGSGSDDDEEGTAAGPDTEVETPDTTQPPATSAADLTPAEAFTHAGERLRDEGTFAYSGTSLASDVNPVRPGMWLAVELAVTGKVDLDAGLLHELGEIPNGRIAETVFDGHQVWGRLADDEELLADTGYLTIGESTTEARVLGAGLLPSWFDQVVDPEDLPADGSGFRSFRATIPAEVMGEIEDDRVPVTAEIVLTLDEAGEPVRVELTSAPEGPTLYVAYDLTGLGDPVAVAVPTADGETATTDDPDSTGTDDTEP